jgi:integrase
MARREFQDPSLLTRTGRQGDEYYIRYRIKVVRMVDGKAKQVRREKHHVLGLCSEMTERQAMREREKVLREVNGQAYSIQSQIPFPEFAKLYRERWMPTLRATTQTNYDRLLRTYIEPYFAGNKLCDVKPEDVHRFIMGLDIAPLSRKSVRGVLGSIFNLATTWGYLETANPVTLAFLLKKLPSTRKREKRIWTMNDLQKILLSVRPDVCLIIETLVWTGMRISECLGLHWLNVDTDAGFIRVQERQCRGDVGAPKSEKGLRLLPLGELKAKYAAMRSASGDLVFRQADGRPYTDCELLANYLTPILKRLGLKFDGGGWHVFRKMHLTWFSENGATAFETQEQAGHSRIETTSIYVKPALARREVTVLAMQGKYRELCGTDAGWEGASKC